MLKALFKENRNKLSTLVKAFFSFQRHYTHIIEVNNPNVEPCLYTMWHGNQCAIFGLPNKGITNVLISRSKDGDAVASGVEMLGFKVIRGSKGKKGAIEPGETVYWTGFEVLRLYAVGEKAGKTREETLLETGGIFIEFIVRAENNIVGYAVMEIISVDYESAIFGIELRDSAYFPKVDGEYQNVTQKYLEERIQSAKAG
jgi:hypothetical protein